MATEDRFWTKVQVTPACWIWTAGVDGKGYGAACIGSGAEKRQRRAHRLAYELLAGPIPDGMVIDHVVCGNRRCVNPAHMEVVTVQENTARSNRKRDYATRAKRALRTHCKNGHEFTPANIYLWRGTRICRACQARRQAAKRAS